MVECLVCGQDLDLNHIEFNYCPLCGAGVEDREGCLDHIVSKHSQLDGFLIEVLFQKLELDLGGDGDG